MGSSTLFNGQILTWKKPLFPTRSRRRTVVYLFKASAIRFMAISLGCRRKYLEISRVISITVIYFPSEILQKMKPITTSVVLAIPFLAGSATASLNCTVAESLVTERACEYTACAPLETATIGQVVQAACRADCSNDEEYGHEPFI